MTGPLTVDPRQTVRWAYAFLLGREPESEAAVDLHLMSDGGITLDLLRRQFIESDEFIVSLRQAGLEVAGRKKAIGPIGGFLEDTPVKTDGFFTDRFGIRTRVAYLPPAYQAFSGQVGSADGLFDMPVHETEEMNALLRSVSDASGSFAVMELGAGWGPWIVLGAYLARRRGLSTSLMGVEGSSDHVAFMHTHLIDNGFDPAAHHIIHAVAGTQDGVAYFPKLSDPSLSWGAEASYESEVSGFAEMDEVPCLSLRTLLDRMPVLDFLHSDVQGAEADVFSAAIEAVNRRVRRICIGTHGRAVEAKLLDLLTNQDWVLEFEQPCKLVQDGTKLVNAADGVQVWRNQRAL